MPDTIGRVMGLDVGEARTGVALSDPLQTIASPHTVLEMLPGENLAEAVRQLADEWEVVCIVAGVPLDREGGRGPQADKVLGFVDRLQAVATAKVVTQDERFSTASAERALRSAGVRAKKGKRVVDKIAAAYILQAYLDYNKRE